MGIVKQMLTIYSWALIGVLIVFLWRIAYFYQKASAERLRYRLLVIPSLLFATGALWHIIAGEEFIRQPIGDALLCSGGVTLVLFGSRLQELMTGGR